jgi:VWFA-related protein
VVGRLLTISIIFVASIGAYAQSGRRAAPTPVPTPVAAAASGYSESRPSARRTNRPERTLVVGAASSSAGDDENEVLRIDTNLVSIPVSVVDKNGLYITGLRQENFKIFEDGAEQEIAYFGVSDQPFTVALLIDVSPSTAYRIDEIRRAAIAFVDQLQPEDSVIVIDFDQNVRVRTDATKDRRRIYDAINKADFGNGTSLYNAVDEAIRKRLGRITGRKAVVLFTDGVDTTSRKNTYDSTLNYAEESEALIFPIYYNTYGELRGRTLGGGGGIGFPRSTVIVPAGSSASDYALGRQYLDDLSAATGGRVFRPESTPGGLTRAFEGIADELRRQYNIGYVPKTEGKPGERRQIRVRVDRPNLVIRARDSYIVGSATANPNR